MIKNYKVPQQTSLEGLREMRQEDASQVRVLLNKYLSKFELAPVFETDEDIKHWICPHEKVVWSYVVEHPETKKITDMFSFYSLPSSVINNPKHTTLNAAYMFYYAIEISDDLNELQKEKFIKKRLNELMADALVLAKNVSIQKKKKNESTNSFIYFFFYLFRLISML
jgi:glycylpeptide N-tetradecanoyltransferase